MKGTFDGLCPGRTHTIINEAFASTVSDGGRVRKELNHIVIWFANPKEDDLYVSSGAGGVPTFVGDGEARAAACRLKKPCRALPRTK